MGMGVFGCIPKMHFTLLKLSSRNYSSGNADIPRVRLFGGFQSHDATNRFSTTFHPALTLHASDTYDYFSILLLIYCYVSYVDPMRRTYALLILVLKNISKGN